MIKAIRGPEAVFIFAISRWPVCFAIGIIWLFMMELYYDSTVAIYRTHDATRIGCAKM